MLKLRWWRILVLSGVMLSGCFAALNARAGTADSVVVTGNITNVELSLSIDEPVAHFGNINSTGTRQPTDAMFSRSLPAGFGNGAYWVMIDPVTIRITSPVAWTGAVCVADALHPPDRGIGLSLAAPDAIEEAARVMASPIPADCRHPSSWNASAPIGSSQWFSYLTTAVTDLDTSGPFSLTLRFSVSTGG